MNIGSLFERSALFWSERTALKDERKSLTYSQLDERSNRVVNTLASLGIEQGQRVAVLAWNRVEIVEVEIALYKGGFVRVPINARLSPEETVHVCNDSQANLLIVDPEHLNAGMLALSECPTLNQLLVMGEGIEECSYEDALAKSDTSAQLAQVQEDDIAVLHYTSGSSGVLKAAMQTVGNRLSILHKVIYRAKLNPDHPETMVHVGPITHASGMSIMPLLTQGHKHVILSRFDVDNFLGTVESEQAQQTYLVPTMINRILAHENRHKYDISSLRQIRYGAAPISAARLKEAIEFFGPILNQGYGAGEVNHSVCMLSEADHASAINGNPELLNSCGRPLFETEVKIIDENGNPQPVGVRGEMVIRGKDVMKGYWNAPALTEKVLINGYYHTGDIAYSDEEGYLFIVDRKKDMIVSGGFNIYPNEVENTLYNHQAVFEACVVGVPDPDLGEVVKAVVVLKDGSNVSESELIDHCTKELGKFKKPDSIDFVASLPKNNAGKIQRRDVRATYWKDEDRQI